MVELALLATQAQRALVALSDLPAGTVKEVRKGLEPISAGVGRLIESVAGTVDKLGDGILIAPERRRLERLRRRFENEDVILRAEIAEKIAGFQLRQHRSCLAFLTRESKAIQQEFRAQMEFLQSWKNGILKNIQYDRYPSRDLALEDLRIVTDLMKFEVAIFRRARVAIVDTLIAARGMTQVTVGTLENLKARRLLAGTKK